MLTSTKYTLIGIPNPPECLISKNISESYAASIRFEKNQSLDLLLDGQMVSGKVLVTLTERKTYEAAFGDMFSTLIKIYPKLKEEDVVKI